MATSAASTPTNHVQHPVNIYDSDGTTLTATLAAASGDDVYRATPEWPSGPVPRVTIGGVDIPVKQEPSYTLNIPAGKPKNNIIVSMIVAQALKDDPEAYNVFIPDSNPGSAVRNDKGTITGVKGVIWVPCAGDAAEREL